MPIIVMSDSEKLELSKMLDDSKGPFERSLERDLNAFFAMIALDIQATYATFGGLPNLQQYRLELEAILKKSYRKTGALFSSTFQRTLREAEARDDQNAQDIRDLQEVRSEEEDNILLLLFAFYQLQAREQADYILTTTENIMIEAELEAVSNEILMDTAESVIDEARKPKTPAEKQKVLAKDISKEVTKRNRKRAPNIADDQVGDIAQKAQAIEAAETAKGAGRKTIPAVPTKTWVTTFVNSRHSHMAAHNQKKPLSSPFIVQNQQLMFPKDSSRGATLDNVINCHCNAVVTM